MVETTIVFGKYIIIMGIFLVGALISVFFGIYYLIKFINETRKNPTKSQKYIYAVFMYLILLPLLLIIFSHNFMAPYFARTIGSSTVKSGLLFHSSSIIHNTSPGYKYITIILISAIAYLIFDKFILKREEQNKK